MKGWIWAAGDDGSSWYRCTLPSLALGWEGHRFPACEVLPETQRRQADIVIGSRVAAPVATQAWQSMADRGARLVLDFDDDYLHIDPTNAKAHAFWSDRSIQRRLMRNVLAADTITVASEGLAAVWREHHGDVRVVPNGLPAQYLTVPRTYEGKARIGWAGSAGTVAELHLAERALKRAASLPGVSGLQFIGALPESTGLPGRHVEWISGNERYLAAVAEADIWVAPYRDTAFNRAKFPTKALEAGFLGIPLVVSDIEPYRRWTEGKRPEQCGVILVQAEHEWGRALKALSDDPSLRATLGRAARSHAAQYALQGLGRVWADALR